MNGTPSTVPSGWPPGTNVNAVLTEIEKRVERLRKIDSKTAREGERQLIYSYIIQLIKTGHS